MTDFPPMELEAKFSIDFLDCATRIETICGDLLLPAPEGVYLKGQVDPVIKAGHNYYTRKGAVREHITSLDGVKDSIYDESGKLAIAKTFMLRPEQYISNQPWVPYRGAKITELLLNESLGSFVHYNRWAVNFRDRIRAQFKEGVFQEVITFERVETLVDNIPVSQLIAERPHLREQFRDVPTTEIVEDRTDPFDTIIGEIDEIFFLTVQRELKMFLGEKRWYMYNGYLRGTQLVVERYCDWRAWQWEQEHGKSATQADD